MTELLVCDHCERPAQDGYAEATLAIYLYDGEGRVLGGSHTNGLACPRCWNDNALRNDTFLPVSMPKFGKPAEAEDVTPNKEERSSSAPPRTSPPSSSRPCSEL